MAGCQTYELSFGLKHSSLFIAVFFTKCVSLRVIKDAEQKPRQNEMT